MDVRERIKHLSEEQLRKLQASLAARRDASQKGGPASGTSQEPIAIIGLAFRLPGEVNDLEGLWSLLKDGGDAIRKERFPRGLDGHSPGSTSEYWGGYLQDVDKFDAAFFKLSPKEAEMIDPQQRLFMQTAWHAIEDAGYRPGHLAGTRTGVYAGICSYDYGDLLQLQQPLARTAHCVLGTSPSMLANRISFLFDFRGPSETLDTACSSSLIALHHAVQAMRQGDCEQALVGAVNLLLSPRLFAAYSDAGMLSPDGRCRTFDARANGYVRGEGVTVLMLKPLARARADGDRIHGLVRSTAVNHGGRANSLTAPNPNAQTELLVSAYEAANVPLQSIGYVEAHGTGTPLGDPLEVEALQNAFAKLGQKRGEDLSRHRCALGSIKTNIGHLESAAGAAGLIKILACLRNKQLPPTVHFEQMNPHLHLTGSPFYVVDKLQPWEPLVDGAGAHWPRRAGVSSFGFGGANAHAVIEEYVEPVGQVEAQRQPSSGPRLVVFSARTGEQLEQMIASFRDQLLRHPALTPEQLESLAYTSQTGREPMRERVAFLVNDADELLRALKAHPSTGNDAGNVIRGRVAKVKAAARRPAFESNGVDASGRAVQGQDLRKLAQNWVEGLEVDWHGLYGQSMPRKAGLPTYPFARDRHWVSASLPVAEPAPVEVREQRPDATLDGVLQAVPRWEDKALSGTGASTSRPAASLLVLANAGTELESRAASLFPSTEIASLSSARDDAEESVGERFSRDFLDVFRRVRRRLEGRGTESQNIVVLSSAERSEPRRLDFSGLAYAPLMALLKTACQENPSVRGKLITVPSTLSPERILAILEKECGSGESLAEEVRYLEDGTRQVRTLKELSPVELRGTGTPARLRDGGVYWITGGLGGLGLIFARHLGRVGSAKLVLTGRSPLSDEKRVQLDALRASGATVEYLQGDIAVREDVQRIVAEIKRRHGRLNGVIHSAGLIRDAFIIKKTEAEIATVMAPKVGGVVNVDLATREEPLDFFVVFSSMTSLLGNVGQADYSAANAFLDGYAEYRQRLVQEGERSGKTLSVSWPLWKEGGMGVDEESLQLLQRRLGMSPMRTETGLAVFDRLLEAECHHLLVLEGDVPRLRRQVLEAGLFRSAVEEKREAARPTELDDGALRRGVLDALKELLAGVIKIPSSKIDETESFEMYGIDSIMIGQINRILDEVLGDNLVSKTLFYEYRTLADLADYFLQEQREAVSRWVGPKAPEPRVQGESAPMARQEGTEPVPGRVPPRDDDTPIAIIGLSGRYPGAEDIRQFWNNLRDAKESIGVIPGERWDVERHYCPDKDEAGKQGKSYSKWGGFIQGFNEFDCLLFNVSPREALNIDPQERKFLESCWEVIEDAGYTRESLGRFTVGVYAGITKTGFDLYRSAEGQEKGFHPQTSFSSLANRVSFAFDFHGPSLPVDTMCSASLTAIHLACEHIRNGSCDIAIAGGVNLYVHPSSYAYLSRMRMLSDDGKNRSFGKGGNGFVPGEGSGAILLKRLDQAEKDGDLIYGVIRGSAINHGGRTSGYTVPNPNAQGELISAALERARVDARTLSYIEAHGTGTELGDPIEIAGLSKAFKKHSEDKQFCAIGSVKANIGHLEAAAGIAGVTKILLQLAHGKLVPSLHSESLNPNINFALSPFKVQRTLSDWERPVIDGREWPRRAGISSFGAGGSNAHVIIEEYAGERARTVRHATSDDAPALVIFSAKTPESLKAYAGKMLAFLRQSPVDLVDLAYTLMVGREAMEHRAAFVVHGTSELRQRLEEYVDGGQTIANCFQGHVGKGNGASPDADTRSVERWLREGQLEKLAALWCTGGSIDWKQLYLDKSPRRLSLPTYAFMKRKIWFEASGKSDSNESGVHSEDNGKLDRTRTAEATGQRSSDKADAAVAPRIKLANLNDVPVKPVSPPSQASRPRIRLGTPGGPAAVETRAAPEPQVAPVARAAPSVRGEGLDVIKAELKRQLKTLLFLDSTNIDEALKFTELGLDSIVGVEWTRLIGERFSLKIPATRLYDYPTISDLAAFIGDMVARTPATAPKESPREQGTRTVPASPAYRASEVKDPVPAADPAPVKAPTASQQDVAQIKSTLEKQLAQLLFLKEGELRDGDKFVDLGLDSIIGVEWVKLINERFGLKLPATKLYDHPTLVDLSAFIAGRLAGQAAPVAPAPERNRPAQPKEEVARPAQDQTASIKQTLAKQLTALLFLKEGEVREDEKFVDLGMDSIIGVEWIKSINQHFGLKLAATKLYDHPTLDDLARFIDRNLSRDDAPAPRTAPSAPLRPREERAPEPVVAREPIVAREPEVPRTARAEPPVSPVTTVRDERPRERESPRPQVSASTGKIAIVGMSGRFPGAKNVDEFWNNLADGVCSVVEVPKNRWDLDEHFNPANKGNGGIYSKWLGALDDIDEFDPLFFNLSPVEAECMDPQQRLFLQEAWKALEDAGYSPESLHGVRGGTYLGIMSNEYWQVLARNPKYMGMAQTMLGTSNAISAARIAYFLNLKGPAISLDTACSSSLVAAHLGAQALLSHEIDMALVGGVTLYLSVDVYRQMCEAGMLSPQGRCFTFDNRADGFVPAEAVTAVVLKRLEDAVEAGDHIYGVIAGSGINQDGKTNGITAPSANSQSELQRNVYRRFGISPESISYVEAHGTGTKLGDPIELDALTTVFREHTDRKRFCAIGSVKTNLGHTAAAAGLVSLEKVLLSLKHGKLAPSINFQQGNEHIDFEDSPFFVNTTLREWTRTGDQPRRAAISSFGFSGTNAHMVIEEYRETPGSRRSRMPDRSRQDGQRVAIPLSARKQDRLPLMAARLSAHLKKVSASEQLDLRDVAYTLQLGRQAMDHRVVFLASDVAELCKQLDAFGSGRSEVENVLRGQASKDRDGIRHLYMDEDLREGIRKWALKGKVKQLGELWVRGGDLDWAVLYEDQPARRIPLPTYPFAQERYWVAAEAVAAEATSSRAKVLHPLVHENTSVFGEQRFATVFSGDEFFLKDHRVGQERVLPGVAYLEMVRAAVEYSGGRKPLGFEHVVWAEPIVVGNTRSRVVVSLRSEGSEVSYEVRSGPDGAPSGAIVHSQGRVVLGDSPSRNAIRVDLAGLRERHASRVTSERLYRLFKERGLDYGAGFRCVEELSYGPDEVLAKLSLPAFLNDGRKDFVLHPSIMDAALQATLGFSLGADGTLDAGPSHLPFFAKAVEIHAPTPAQAYARVRRAPERSADPKLLKFDVEILDANGGLCVRFESVTLKSPGRREQKPEPVRARAEARADVVYARPQWQRKEAGASDLGLERGVTPVLLLWGVQERVARAIEAGLGFETHRMSPPDSTSRGGGVYECFAAGLELVKGILQRKPKDKQPILAVVPGGSGEHLYAPLAGLLKTARLENSKLQPKVVTIDRLETLEPGRLQELIRRESADTSSEDEVRYGSDGSREVKRLVELGPSALLGGRGTQAVRPGSVYWITGGLGGLGTIFVRHLCATEGVTVVLSGRSPLTGDRQKALEELRQEGFQVEYVQVDVGEKEQVRRAFSEIKREHGRIDGIVHSAGILRDSLLLNKSGADAAQVFGSKVDGALNVDEVTKNEALDFFVLFASFAGVFGNVGQGDYSGANAFLDAFARARNGQVARGERRGRTVSIDWPLWRDGGMRIDAQAEAWLEKSKGLRSLRTEQGTEAFDFALSANGADQLIVLSGEREKIVSLFGIGKAEAEPASRVAASAPVEPREVRREGADEAQVRADLLEILSDLLKIRKEDIDAETNFEEYGLDSILMMKVLNRLEGKYDNAVEPSAIVDHPTVGGLAKFLVEEGIAVNVVSEPAPAVEPRVESAAAETRTVEAPRSPEPEPEPKPAPRSHNGARSGKVAIIGVSCRLPQSATPEQFWENLAAGRELITEVSPRRWDPKAVFSADKGARDKTYTNKAGFLEDLAAFDAEFFGISEEDAVGLDPQQRITLELAQELFDRAGYTREELAGSNTSIILGAKENNYVRNNYHLLPRPTLKRAIVNTIGNLVAARVSDFYDLRGTSKTLDTACSSSLVAVHDACQSILTGESDMAVAGGIFLLVDPFAHIGFSRAEVLSDDGKSYVFDERAKGFVLGEGAGLILLKDYDAAVRDGDNILGSILGSAVNNDGRTMGLTVPNQEGQKAVIEAALRRSQVNPDLISYYEAHGTGTLLGDPIEIKAATQVYRQYTQRRQYCALGSVKSNLGHTMTAAGITSLIKVLLSMVNRKIPATLNCSSPHPRFKFQESPFFPNTGLRDWTPEKGSRLAAISSFGFGGTNCHMIVEEAV
ncbi:SDR family NAD(P)-dependent oxidoreductase [Archangium violaceum]|uniref:SDR family NAD(P)-dependent oxidoreductase n=1 Tax=Archangium violaceum TaxID=83451 RepID=UPI00194F9E6E|nr:SDR family NAD(P)-dependent oxidoreductase [Archangium violaceum]QRN93164.1 SDR family NAD(P)-dependent oxidoreductase [Archangium violaceum]UQK84964.1 hypothetical protein [Archangium gephyra]